MKVYAKIRADFPKVPFVFLSMKHAPNSAFADPGEPAIVLERLRVALARTDRDRATPGGDAPRWLDEAARATTDPRLASGRRRLQAAVRERAVQRGDAGEAYAIALQHDTSPAVVEGLARTSTGAALAEALAFRAPPLRRPISPS